VQLPGSQRRGSGCHECQIDLKLFSQSNHQLAVGTTRANHLASGPVSTLGPKDISIRKPSRTTWLKVGAFLPTLGTAHAIGLVPECGGPFFWAVDADGGCWRNGDLFLIHGPAEVGGRINGRPPVQ